MPNRLRDFKFQNSDGIEKSQKEVGAFSFVTQASQDVLWDTEHTFGALPTSLLSVYLNYSSMTDWDETYNVI